MSRTCWFAFAGLSGPAEWSFDESDLVIFPADGRPLVFPVKEIAGIAGDGYTIDLSVPGAAAAPGAGAAVPGAAPIAGEAPMTATVLTLSKLGAEGPTLLDGLQRMWLVARAGALRLGGSGEGRPFVGMVAGPESAGMGAAGTGTAAPDATEPFRALLFEDVLLIGREGRDLDPVFMALTEKIAFDEIAYAIRVSEWPGREIVLSRLGRQTDEFLDALTKRRQALADETASILASTVPSLSPAYRGILAGEWPPGRLRTIEDMDSICPGFEQAFRATWLAGCVRKDEGQFLLDWAGPAACWLGCSRRTAESGEALLWTLAAKNGTWFLEALTGEDRATYHFSAGQDLPALVSRLLCAPQFAKEALYGSPEMLTGERADLAIAAQFLDFLVALRAAFRERIIHTNPESWRRNMEAAASGAPIAK